MHPFCILKEIVADAGCELLREHSDADVFGSYWAIYSGNSKLLRLIWDGKDGWGVLQSPEQPNSWTDVEPIIRASDLEITARNNLKIAAFRDSVERLIAP